MTKLLIALVGLLALACLSLRLLSVYGRTEAQESAECQMQATRIYPDGGFGSTAAARFGKDDPLAATRAALTSDEFREYVRLCMTAKGFEPANDPGSCPRPGVDNAPCFKEKSLIQKLLNAG
jgi:hypothetical protein